MGYNGLRLNLDGDFRLVSLSPVKKVKDNINCQNTTKTPFEFEPMLGIGWCVLGYHRVRRKVSRCYNRCSSLKW